MSESKDFWGYSVSDVVKMDYAELKTVIEASGLPETDVFAVVTKRRVDSDSDAEIFACSRILSAMVGGPDLMS